MEQDDISNLLATVADAAVAPRDSGEKPDNIAELESKVAALVKAMEEDDAQEDPPEYKVPARSDQVFPNAPGQIAVRSYLHDHYQRQLVDSGWLETFIEELRGYPELKGKSLFLELRPRFNKAVLDSRKGAPIGCTDDARNQHKNRFCLCIQWELPPSSPMDVSYDYEIMYNPGSAREYAFQILHSRVHYTWNATAQEGDLERLLVDAGILKEVTVTPLAPDPELASVTMRGTSDLPEFVLVEKENRVLRVAIGDAGSFPEDLACWDVETGIVEPVWVRDRGQLEAFCQSLYKGLMVEKSAVFGGCRVAPAEASTPRLRKVENDAYLREEAKIEAEDHYHLNYFKGWGGSLDVWVSRTKVAVSAGVGGYGEWPFFAGAYIGEPTEQVWDHLQTLARGEDIWLPDGQWGFDGETWKLTKTGPEPKSVELFCPREGPLLEFCFKLMEMAGLEVNVQRFVSWRAPSEKR